MKLVLARSYGHGLARFDLTHDLELKDRREPASCCAHERTSVLEWVSPDLVDGKLSCHWQPS
jgi:hypothetical protein